MSLEKAIKKTNEVREARGIVDEGRRVSVTLKRTIWGLPFPPWMVWVHISMGESDSRDFWRRSSADKYFDEFVEKYGLKEVAF